jgi:hypothetical protein
MFHIKFPINRFFTRPYRFRSTNLVFGYEGLFSPFAPLKICIFFIYIQCKIPEGWRLIFNILTPKRIFFRYTYHTTIQILEHKFHFWPLRAYFRLFNSLKHIFSSSILNSRSMNISHDHTGFGTQRHCKKNGKKPRERPYGAAGDFFLQNVAKNRKCYIFILSFL